MPTANPVIHWRVQPGWEQAVPPRQYLMPLTLDNQLLDNQRLISQVRVRPPLLTNLRVRQILVNQRLAASHLTQRRMPLPWKSQVVRQVNPQHQTVLVWMPAHRR